MTHPLAVIALPTLLPLVALLQLLFPGMLRDQARHYRCAVQVLLTQSTLIFAQWALLRWVVTERTWWLGDEALWIALAIVAAIGLIVSTVLHAREPAETSFAGKPPVSLEFWALGTMAVVGLLWALWAVWTAQSPWDQMAVITASSLAGLAHLCYRKLTAGGTPKRLRITTEMVFLFTQVTVGIAMGALVYRHADNQQASQVAGEWPTYRGNVARTGSADPHDPGPTAPSLLWTFDPADRTGRVFTHSSPTVVGNSLYVGVMHQVLGSAEGYVYCVDAGTGKARSGTTAPGTRVWRYDAAGTLKAVFSTPIVAGGKLFFGEGYHQDRDCRLLCLDASSGDRTRWSKLTGSHVESTPTVEDNRVYFGAGDDGVYCLTLPAVASVVQSDAPTEANAKVNVEPVVAWQSQGLHVDSAPAVVGGRVFVGSVTGDLHDEFAAVALDAESGETLWKTMAPLPVSGSPAYDDGRVYFTLGNGKLNVDADDPQGKVWCLAESDGKQMWEFSAAGSILACPVVVDGVVYVAARDQYLYALAAKDGSVKWKVDLGDPLVAPPVVSGGRVIVLTLSGTLACLDAKSSQRLWQTEELKTDRYDAFAGPTLAGGRIYVACGGKVYCVGDKPPEGKP